MANHRAQAFGTVAAALVESAKPQAGGGRAPFIPVFGDAYMADTRHLSLEEHGAYLLLLMIAWRTDGCRLPDNDKRLAQMLGITEKRWARLKPTVMAFWTLDDGYWTQKRLTKERRFVAKKSEQNANAAHARWNANQLKNNDIVDANAMPAAMRNACKTHAPSPSPSPSPSKKEEEKSAGARMGNSDGPRAPLKEAPM
jgi:uncharacterized protein YdaU (DUF1376 family)